MASAKDFGAITPVIEDHCDLAAIEWVMQKTDGHSGDNEFVSTPRRRPEGL
ncbi:MAG: hypothetical protein ABI895_41075 [Deltaproteobacteria bacterium]